MLYLITREAAYAILWGDLANCCVTLGSDLRICTSALLHEKPSQKPKRLLLLLATQNADKAPKPASFEQRLAMMEIFANEILQSVSHSSDPNTPPLQDGDLIVDVGVTKEARFVDKMAMLEECFDYHYDDVENGGEKKAVEQVHLIGFDTLVRLLDIKYYSPNHSLKPLEALFERHRVRVARRTDDTW